MSISLEYDKYGISESYIPRIFFNRITVDSITSAKPNANLTYDPYIKEKSGFVGTETNTGKKTKIVVDSHIIFNVPDFATFKNMVADDDFSKSFIVYYSLFYGHSTPAPKWTWSNPAIPEPVQEVIKTNWTMGNPHPPVGKIEEPWGGFEDTLGKRIGYRTNNYQGFSIDMLELFKKLKIDTSPDATNINKFDVLRRYEKLFPDGQVYYQLPHTFELEITEEDPENVYVMGFCAVQDFDMTLSLNFGSFNVVKEDFAINAFEAMGLGLDTNSTIGPITMDVIVEDNKVPTAGVLYTISDNQATISPATPLVYPYKYSTAVQGGIEISPQILQGSVLSGGKVAWKTVKLDPAKEDLLRENLFNDYKGVPWLGSVHRNPYNDRFMAGTEHGSRMHAFLDANYVPNAKLIDLRILKKVQESKISIAPLLKSLKKHKTRYFQDDARASEIKKLNVISEPLLSCNLDGNIDGIFGVDYTKFLRKHSVLGGLLENVAVSGLAANDVFGFKNLFFNILKVDQILGSSLNIKIIRVDSAESKIIYNSNGAKNGLYVEKHTLESPPSSGPPDLVVNNLGYLNPIRLPQRLYGFYGEKNVNFVEFYTFTDLDAKKREGINYRYKIEVSFRDPLYIYLVKCLGYLNAAVDGIGKQIGLKQLLTLIEVTRGINISVKSSPSSMNISPYIAEDTMGYGGMPGEKIFGKSKTKMNKKLRELVGYQTVQDFNPQNTGNAMGGSPNKSAWKGYHSEAAYKNSKILDIINVHDTQNEVSSVTNGVAPKLRVLEDLFNSGIVTVLINSQKDPDNAVVSSELQNATNNIINLKDATNLSPDLIQYLITIFDSLRGDLANTIDGLSSVNYSKSTDGSTKNAIKNSKSAINVSDQQKIIAEEKTSSTFIRKAKYGFDYTEAFNVGFSMPNHGLKQIPYNRFFSGVLNNVLSKYFNLDFVTGILSTPDPSTLLVDAPPQIVEYISKYGLSVLPLLKTGVRLPDRLVTEQDFKSWKNILQALLLYKHGNLTRIDENSIFGFKQSNVFNMKTGNAIDPAYYVWNMPLGAQNLNDVGGDLYTLKSVERNQMLAAKKGLVTKDRSIGKTNEVVTFAGNKQTENAAEIVSAIEGYETNATAEYFLSYVNNYINVLGNSGVTSAANLYAESQTSEWFFQVLDQLPDAIKDLSAPLLSLVVYGIDKNDPILGSPTLGSTYKNYYESGTPTWTSKNKILFDQYAEYFFDFINLVKVEYLKGFESYDFGEIADVDTFEALSALNLSGYVWEQFTPQVLQKPIFNGEVLICRISDHKASLGGSLTKTHFQNNRIKKKLKDYELFYKYFLIIVGETQKDLTIKPFGSTLPKP